MKPPKFIVIRFINRNGFVSWRVNGQLVAASASAKTSKQKKEAAAEKAALEIKAEQLGSGLRSITTALGQGFLGIACHGRAAGTTLLGFRN